MVDCIRMRALAASIVAAAVLMTSALILATPAAADCGSSCRNAYNQCRIATKGSASCESQFTSCMQSCRSR